MKVIVIGGGVAGLSAAIKLLEANISDIVILEASDRLGGRIHTIPFRNFQILHFKTFVHACVLIVN